MRMDLYLLASKKVGFLKRESCILFFYKDEVLITTISKDKMKQIYAENKEEVKSSGGGFFKQMVGAARALPMYAEKLSEMDKDEIKKENTEVISKESITKIRYVSVKEMVDYESNTTSKSEGKLILVLKDRKIKFFHNYQDRKVKNYINDYIK